MFFFVNHPASLTYIINYHFKLKVACRTYRYFKAEYICTCVIQLTSPSEKPISFSFVISSAAPLKVEVDGKFLLFVEEMLRVAIGWFQHYISLGTTQQQKWSLKNRRILPRKVCNEDFFKWEV